MTRWTRKSIVAEIRRLHEKGESLAYSAAESNHLNLVRAAAWHFGTWRRAIETAGLDYGALSLYQKWDRERIVHRIRELHQDGADLSWREVSLRLDPALAAAALRSTGFSSWRDAIEAAGLKIEDVARYRQWDHTRVVQEIQTLHQAGAPLSSREVQQANQSLFCAARRRFGSWDDALKAAGLNPQTIRLRRAKPRKRTAGKRISGKRPGGHNKGASNQLPPGSTPLSRRRPS